MNFVPNSLAVALIAQAAPRAATLDGGTGDGFFLMLLQTLLVLGFVCGLAYLIFRWVLPRLSAARSARGMVRIVDVVGLDARKRLYVIEVAGHWLLVAASEAGVHLVRELDAAAAAESALEGERAAEKAQIAWKGFGSTARAAFADRLSRLMNRRR
ncbi:MAG TPA: flagellar biosynthetic protein FliO [Pyrinomonadaceae bacterium]|jgi:flagellar biogenesis protein FliO